MVDLLNVVVYWLGDWCEWCVRVLVEVLYEGVGVYGCLVEVCYDIVGVGYCCVNWVGVLIYFVELGLDVEIEIVDCFVCVVYGVVEVCFGLV